MKLLTGFPMWYFWLVSSPSRASPSCMGAGEGGQQTVISTSEPAGTEWTNNSNLIFSSFAGLLQQWPNTFAYSGHSIVPGVVPEGTALYHATNRTDGPPREGLEWLAFDPEMSYHAAINLQPGNISLYTFLASRPLRIIYFDGQSGSKSTPGFADSQFAIINSTVPEGVVDQDHFLAAEYSRAAALCLLANKHGFEGVVRMSTGFELVWCDFAQGLQLFDVINVSDPYAENPQPRILRENEKGVQTRSPPVYTSPFYTQALWNFIRSGAQHFFAPGEVRVILDPEGFISFYDGVESLDAKRRSDGTSSGPRSRHRLYGISKADARKVQARLWKVLERKNSEGWRVQDPGSRDWRAVVLTIVKRYSPQLAQLEELLDRHDLDPVDQAVRVRASAYSLIMPSLDFSHWNHAEPPANWVPRGIRKCSRAYTPPLSAGKPMSHSIRLIMGAIEGTMERLCGTIYGLLQETIRLNLPLTLPSSPFNATLHHLVRAQIPQWRRQLHDLQQWLGWASWSRRCQPRCQANEICIPPLWALFHGAPITNLTHLFPLCVNSSSLDKVPGQAVGSASFLAERGPVGLL